MLKNNPIYKTELFLQNGPTAEKEKAILLQGRPKLKIKYPILFTHLTALVNTELTYK